MNTTKENKEYIEPTNFSGTKGEWRRSSKKYLIVAEPIKDRCTAIAEIQGDYNSPEIKANAILLSQSKELVKALQDIIKWKDAAASTEYLFDVLQAIDRSRAILDKALNINP